MMRLSSYIKKDGTASFGIARPDVLLDVNDAVKARYPTLTAVIGANALAELTAQSETFLSLAPTDVRFLPPIPEPGKIICVGLNYRAHIAETGRDMPTYPSIFTRYPASLVGHGEGLVRPRASDRFDYEGELAFVIGKAGRHIPAAQAMDHIAGFTCLNDGSIRDFQRHTSQFWPGKNFAKSGSVGPWLVTPDEVGDPAGLTLETRLNGEIVQSTSVGDLLFDIPALVNYLSSVIDLLPGDVVATGTPGGVGLFRDPPLWMKRGDVVEVEITNIGTLSNPVVDED